MQELKLKLTAWKDTNLSVMVFAFNVLQKKLTVRCSVPKVGRKEWIHPKEKVVGGWARPEPQKPSDSRTTATKPEDIW